MSGCYRARMHTPPARWSRSSLAQLLAMLLACCLLPACFSTHPWKEQSKPWTAESIAGAPQVRIERTDGSSLTLAGAVIVEDDSGTTITGKGIPQDSKTAQTFKTGQTLRVDLANVTRLETNKTDPAREMANVIGWTVVGVLILLTALALSEGGIVILGL